jgi:hypothetical protein
MKNKLIISLLLVIAPCFIFSQNRLDSLLIQVDCSIKLHETYVSKKEARIKVLKDKLKLTIHNSENEYELNLRLYKEYKSYISDSAIYYLHKNVKVGSYLKDNELENQSRIQLAYLMGSLGMYKEGVDILETINRKKLTPNVLCDYYVGYDHIYGELAFYTQDKENLLAYS